ncbi:MAG: transcriptional regulator [Bradymonadaceae bacterium]|nr:transcriptional regulator [Lujinxingiaceae bacterium]
MRGYNYRTDDQDDAFDRLPAWESLVVEGVGEVIEFWGFKRNMGRVWGLLYLRDQPMSAAELQEALDLSKGAVSMITRDLEQWSVVERVRPAGQSIWHFVAKVDFVEMISRVLKEREQNLVERVKLGLADAERLAREAKADKAVIERIARMRRLADFMDQALSVFLRTARLDVSKTREVLK